MNVSVVLANFAKVSDNMLDVQQAGWSFIGPEPFSFFVAGVALCAWHEANQKHEMKVELLDADGSPVPNPETGQPLMVSATFEIGRPPGTKPGASMPSPSPFSSGWPNRRLVPSTRFASASTASTGTTGACRLPYATRLCRPRPPKQENH
jgi:hypothetical protein